MEGVVPLGFNMGFLKPSGQNQELRGQSCFQEGDICENPKPDSDRQENSDNRNEGTYKLPSCH